jgi:hypothetical protein
MQPKTFSLEGRTGAAIDSVRGTCPEKVEAARSGAGSDAYVFARIF